MPYLRYRGILGLSEAENIRGGTRSIDLSKKKGGSEIFVHTPLNFLTEGLLNEIKKTNLRMHQRALSAVVAITTNSSIATHP